MFSRTDYIYGVVGLPLFQSAVRNEPADPQQSKTDFLQVPEQEPRIISNEHTMKHCERQSKQKTGNDSATLPTSAGKSNMIAIHRNWKMR